MGPVGDSNFYTIKQLININYIDCNIGRRRNTFYTTIRVNKCSDLNYDAL